MTIWIAREREKTGGVEYHNPGDAIEAAARWMRDTGARCVVIMRNDDGVELESSPHTSEAEELAYETFLYELDNSHAG